MAGSLKKILILLLNHFNLHPCFYLWESFTDSCLIPSVCLIHTEGAPEHGSADRLGQSFVTSESLMYELISPVIASAASFFSS